MSKEVVIKLETDGKEETFAGKCITRGGVFSVAFGDSENSYVIKVESGCMRVLRGGDHSYSLTLRLRDTTTVVVDTPYGTTAGECTTSRLRLTYGGEYELRAEAAYLLSFDPAQHSIKLTCSPTQNS